MSLVTRQNAIVREQKGNPYAVIWSRSSRANGLPAGSR